MSVNRRFLSTSIAGALALGAVVVAGGAMASSPEAVPAAAPALAAVSAPTINTTYVAPKPTATPTATATPVLQRDLIRIEAVGGDCWLEVRRAGSQGKVLYSGTLGKGDTRKFKGKDIWMVLGDPSSVRLESSGKKVDLKSDVGPWTVAIVQGRVTQGP
jgi:hypothetical protein